MEFCGECQQGLKKGKRKKEKREKEKRKIQLTASQISISAQQEPVFPSPELASPFDGFHPSTLA